MIFVHRSLQDGTVLRYIDLHPEEKGIPKATYDLGHGYYLFQELPQAATYFLRVAQRYPGLPLADDASFAYLQFLEDNTSVSRAELMDGYKAYLRKYPEGRHADVAKDRLGGLYVRRALNAAYFENVEDIARFADRDLHLDVDRLSQKRLSDR